jgi:SNF2 family DNA or RNA helicase
MIMDEYHLYGLLNRKSKIYKFTKSIANLIPNLILATGTPQRRNPADWFAPLSLVEPKTFTSYWNYVNEYCIAIKDKFGISIEPVPQNETIFRRMLDEYRRQHEDKSYLPPMTRQPIPVDMTPKQQKLYGQLVKEMFVEEDGQFIITQNKLAMTMRCRQLMVCPRILGFDDDGSTIEIMKDLTEQELSEDNPVIIFTPFRKAIPLILESLNKLKPKPDIYIVHGGMEHEEHKEIQEKFQDPRTKNKVLICVIKSGTTMTLTEANAAIFIGYEYSVGDNTQAEDRLYRETQTKHVRCYYILYRGNPVDARAIEILNNKTKSIGIGTSANDYYKEIVNVKD